MHFLQPMQRIGSTWIRPKGGWSSSGTQNMQSATGQYSTHAGDPAQPVQHSVITANSFGFFFRGVVRPVDLGSNFNSSGTIPAALFPVVSAGIWFSDYTVKSGRILPSKRVKARKATRCVQRYFRVFRRLGGHAYSSHFRCPDTTISTCTFLLYWPFRRSP